MKESENISFRDNAIELLELLSSLDAQSEYQKNVPIANVPAELLCMWFDDFYHLTDEFKVDFTKSELMMLSSFHSFFEDSINKLPDSSKGLEALQSSSVWLEVTEKAKAALKIFLG